MLSKACVPFGDVRNAVGPKPTYGRDGDASPRKLGFSKIVSLLVSLNEPKLQGNKVPIGQQGQDVRRCRVGLV